MIVELEKILLNEELIIHFRFSGLISPMIFLKVQMQENWASFKFI